MSNPFEDDDDFCFEKKPGADDVNIYAQRIDDTLNESLASTQRTLRTLEESEQIGVATAKDLSEQGEKLRRVDRQLDEMNSTTQQTQQHLNSIKSVFGGLKNKLFSRGSVSKSPSTGDNLSSATAGDGLPPSKLSSTVNRLESDSSGFPSSTTSGGGKFKGGSKGPEVKQSARIESLGGTDTRWGAMDQEIDDNLGAMSSNLSRIRELGRALGDEIDDQNKLLDKIDNKAQKTDMTVRDQDRQMQKLMGKKMPPK